MDPISTRELVAWVLVLGLLVTLVSSKRPIPKNSSKSVPMPPKSPQKRDGLEKHKLKFEVTPPKIFGKVIKPHVKKKQPNSDPQGFLKDEPHEKGWLDQEAADKKKGADLNKVAGLPKTAGSKGSRRRKPDQVRRSQNGTASVRDRKRVAAHGSSPHKGKKRSA